MLQGRTHQSWISLVCVIAGCNIDRLRAEFYVDFSTGGTTASSAEISESSSSTSDTSTSDTSSSEGDSSTSAPLDDTTTETSSDSSSEDDTSPTPFCGDGVVDAPDEECDAPPESTESCVHCKKVRLIFVTSVRLSGETINGLTGADSRCKSLANDAKLADPGSPIKDPGNFLALLSTSTVPAVSRHFPGEGPYRLVNGLQVSHSFAALFMDPLENTITVDERSQTQTGPVWTGTNLEGGRYPGIDFCGDWKDSYGTANYGYNEALDAGWIHLGVDTDCLSERPIYCIEQE